MEVQVGWVGVGVGASNRSPVPHTCLTRCWQQKAPSVAVHFRVGGVVGDPTVAPPRKWVQPFHTPRKNSKEETVRQTKGAISDCWARPNAGRGNGVWGEVGGGRAAGRSGVIDARRGPPSLGGGSRYWTWGRSSPLQRQTPIPGAPTLPRPETCTFNLSSVPGRSHRNTEMGK